MAGRGAATSTSFAVSGSPAPPVKTLTDTSCSPTDFIEVSEKTTRNAIFFTLDLQRALQIKVLDRSTGKRSEAGLSSGFS
jgi:hypothetical protein